MKGTFLAVTFCFLQFQFVLGQSPGGVATPTFWLKATTGTATTTNNAANTNWVSQGSVASTLSQATGPNRPLYRDGSGLALPIASSDNVFNYTPYLFFDGTNDCLFSTTSHDLGSFVTGISEFGVIRPESGIVFFEWNGPNAMVKCKSDGPQAITDGLGAVGVNNQYLIPNNNLPKIQHLSGRSTGLINTTGSGNAFSGYNQILVPALVNNNNPSGVSADRTNVGSNVNTGEFTRGGVAEIIVYNRILTELEQLRVNSYLSVKHGVMLGNPGSVTNYLRADGTTIWNSVAAYHNKVIGIGRDDNSGLLQKQSHQDDDSVRIYLSTLTATNALNSGAFASNGSFIMLGSNTGKLCATVASNNEVPAALTNCTLYSRLEREWMVQRTTAAESFNMNIKLAGCGAPASVNVADLRLLVDDDGNFSNGGTQCYYNGDGTGLVFSYASPMITITGISTVHIPNNSIRFITIGSVTVATPLPIQLIAFNAVLASDKTIQLDWFVDNENNLDHYTVDHSTDMFSWSQVAYSNASGAALPKHLSGTDLNSRSGTSYYRIRTWDENMEKKEELIDVLEIKSDEDFVIYPNPASSQLVIELKNSWSTTFSITDTYGRNIPVPITQIDENMYVVSCKDLASGVYYILESKSNICKKVIVEH